MKHLFDKKRVGVAALLFTMLGAAALVFGAGAAQAGYPCNDQPPPQDTTANVNDTYVGLDVYNTGSTSGAHGFWLCWAATGGEANQSYVVVTAWDTGPSTPGVVVSAGGCGVPTLGNDTHPWAWPCGAPYVLEHTGATVGVPPTPGTNPPGGGNGTGGSVGTGGGVCVYANSLTPTCAGGLTVADVTVREGDLPDPTVTTVSSPPPCTGVNNMCHGLRVRVGYDPNPTVSGTVAGIPVPPVVNIPQNCVQVNSTCP